MLAGTRGKEWKCGRATQRDAWPILHACLTGLAWVRATSQMVAVLDGESVMVDRGAHVEGWVESCVLCYASAADRATIVLNPQGSLTCMVFFIFPQTQLDLQERYCEEWRPLC